MYLLLALCVCIFAVTVRFIVVPVVAYVRDVKGLGKFPKMTPLSGLTNIPYMLESRKGNRSIRLAELHKVHPVIRVGPNALSYGDCRAIKDIYGHSSKCEKDDMYDVLGGPHRNLADVTNRPDHARKRKMMSAAYAIKNLEDWEYKIADKISRLVKQFDTRCTDSESAIPILQATGAKVTADGVDRVTEEIGFLDYRAWTNFFTMDAIADIGLSQSFGFIDAGDDKVTCEARDESVHTAHFRESLHSALVATSHIAWSPSFYHFLRMLTDWVLPKYTKMWKTGDSFDGIVNYQAKQRMARYSAGERLDDFFQALMEDKNGVAHNLAWGEVISEISLMMNAGSVSTAIAINNVMYLLLKYPKKLAILREEVDASLSPSDPVAPYDKIKNLPYLRACLDEAMRLFPPTPFNLPRKTPTGGQQILGDFIAGDVTVGMSAYVAHRDEKYFSNPEEFVPERWLGEEGKTLKSYFLPFSAGSRGCIGRNISYLENYMITATMIHRYDFALPHADWEQYRYEHFNQVPGPLPLKVARRHRKGEI